MKVLFSVYLLTILSFNLQAQRIQFDKNIIANSVLNLRRDTILNGKPTSIVGTGTFVSKGNQLFIVTAGHVAKAIDNKGYVILKGHGDQALKLRITDFLSGNAVVWKIHPDADVAVLELKPNKLIFEKGYLNQRFLPHTIFFETLASINRETILTTFGFPLGLGAEGFFSPLTYRTFPSSGLITLARFDNGKPSTFILLENPSTGGYSGGPVFDLGKIETGSLEMTSGQGTICYGIIHGTISDETGGKIAAITPSYYVLSLL